MHELAGRSESEKGFPRRLGDRLCLDFANTLDPRLGPHPKDFLRGFPDLIRWADEGGVLADAEVTDLLAEAERRPDQATARFKRAMILRETIYRVFRALARGESPMDRDLALLHQEYLFALSLTTFAVTGDQFDLKWRAEAPSFDRMLGAIARSAVEVLMNGERRRIKECLGPGEECGWLYYDTSKNNSRRWCSMEGCGSQAKMRRYRARQRRVTGATVR